LGNVDNLSPASLTHARHGRWYAATRPAPSRLTAIALIFAASLLSGCNATNETTPDAAATGQDWDAHGGTSNEQRYSKLNDINADNVGKLSLAWSFELDTNRGQEATPLVIDGVLYTSTAWSKVVALDAATGKQLWAYDPQVPGRAAFNACCDVINRGVAYHDGKIFLGTLDGRLQAINAKTGKLLWSTMTVDPSKPYTISGAPRVMRGKVVIGNGGAEYGVRGYVSAYDEHSGKLVWRFYTVPGDPAKPDKAASDDILNRLARPTWSGVEYIKTGGGGTVWDSIVYDADLNQLYIGVGNGSPNNHVLRSEGKGDNAFLASIVALDPDTGKYIWHYQEVPGETWDYTASQQIMLATLPIKGDQRKVILHAPKNGFFYVLDRKTGKLISAEKFAPVNWADRIDLKTGRPVENPEARYLDKPFLATTGGMGAHSWHAMSFSPKTGLVYIPVQSVPALYNRDKSWTFRPGRWNLGFDMLRGKIPLADSDRKAMVAGNKGWLSAWDPIHQKEVWRVQHTGPWNGGTVATAGDLVFQGTADKTFDAYRASDGKKLWSFNADAAIIAAPVTFTVKGEQYVAVLSGNGGALPLAWPTLSGPKSMPNGRVLAFKIGGKATLPAYEPTTAPVQAVTVNASAATIEQGRVLFGDNCASCHGVAGWSSGIIPDLRRSAAVGDPAIWQAIVIDGALQERGMISFKPYLKPAEVESIRAYLANETHALVKPAPSK
jgi:PQQ-dependent dehydrogenase (methanol/ethanol family)